MPAKFFGECGTVFFAVNDGDETFTQACLEIRFNCRFILNRVGEATKEIGIANRSPEWIWKLWNCQGEGTGDIFKDSRLVVDTILELLRFRMRYRHRNF